MNKAKRDRYIRLLKSKSNLSWVEFTADAVKEIIELLEEPQIIHCKDCEYGSPDGKHGCKSYHFKLYETHEMGSNDFCSRAEPKGGAV